MLDCAMISWMSHKRHTQVIKQKVDKLDFLTIFKVCGSKDTINRVKRQATEWAKIFAYHIHDKGLISRTYRELLKLKQTNKKQTNLFKNGQRS